MKIKIQNLIIVLAIFAGIHQAAAQGTTAFTYQGQLHDGGTNANGAYTMTFKLYDSVSGGSQIGSDITTGPTLANGLFTVNLDFGAGAFNGSARWLDITVQSGSDSETLAPRVQILPTPYAIYAGIANTASNLNGTLPASQLTNTLLSAQLSGAYSNVMTFNNPTNSFGGTFSGDGSSLINLNASQLTSGTVPNGRLSGTYGSPVTFNNSANNFSGNGNGMVDLNAANLVGTISDDRLSDNIPLLDADQTFTGEDTFDQDVTFNQDILMGDWDVGLGDLDGYSGVLGFYSDGELQVAIAPDGAEDPDGNPVSLVTYGQIYIAEGDLNVATGNVNATGENQSVNASIVNATTVNAYGYNMEGEDDDAVAAKTSLTSTSGQNILNQLASLPLSTWSSKKDTKTHHVGPNAHDFQAAFGLGKDDKTINLVDENGVALAAIQGLNEKLKEKDAQIEALNKRLTALEQLVKTSTQK